MLTANRAAQSAQPRRGDMFIAKRTARIAKPRRGGMFVGRCAAGFAKPLLQGHTPIHAAPTELGRASGVVVAINMALLTELFAHILSGC